MQWKILRALVLERSFCELVRASKAGAGRAQGSLLVWDKAETARIAIYCKSPCTGFGLVGGDVVLWPWALRRSINLGKPSVGTRLVQLSFSNPTLKLESKFWG